MCNNCKVSFKDFYYSKQLDEALSQKQLLQRSNKERKEKSTNDFNGIKSFTKKDLPAGVIRYSFVLNKYKNSHENKEQHTLIDFNPNLGKNGKIINTHCSCGDFLYRSSKYLFIKNDIATKTIPQKFEDIQKQKGRVYQHRPPDITNPQGKLIVCKHILGILKNFDFNKGEIKK